MKVQPNENNWMCGLSMIQGPDVIKEFWDIFLVGLNVIFRKIFCQNVTCLKENIVFWKLKGLILGEIVSSFDKTDLSL